jgi:polysaccharide chain length determinant protein (PEP-CTERM system associated)
MQEAYFSLQQYIRDVWRYRWYAMVVAWLIVITGWTIVAYTPNRHTATARLYVDASNPLKPVLHGQYVEQESADYVNSMFRQMSSRDNLSRIVDAVGFDSWPRIAGNRDDLLDELKNDIDLHSERVNNADYIYTISYRSIDREIAQQVVQAFITFFSENILNATSQDSDLTQRFLDQRIQEYEQKLTATELSLQEFKRKNIDALPGQEGGYFERLHISQQTMEEIELEIRELRKKRDELNRQLAETPKAQRLVTTDGMMVISPTESRLLAAQTRLDELLLKFTERHPDVIQTRQNIAELEQQRTAELTELASGVAQSSTIPNPMHQELKLAMGEIDGELAALEVRRDEYKRRIERLRKQVDTLPVVEAQLQRLDRDYEVNKERYNSLVARREAAEMTKDIQKSYENILFNVIDPPTTSLWSAWRRRLLANTAILFLGIGGGLGFAFLLSQIRPVIHSPGALEELTGLPVVATISRAWTPKQLLRRRLELTTFASTGVLLVGAYGVALFLQFRNTELMASLLQTLGGDG